MRQGCYEIVSEDGVHVSHTAVVTPRPVRAATAHLVCVRLCGPRLCAHNRGQVARRPAGAGPPGPCGPRGTVPFDVENVLTLHRIGRCLISLTPRVCGGPAGRARGPRSSIRDCDLMDVLVRSVLRWCEDDVEAGARPRPVDPAAFGVAWHVGRLPLEVLDEGRVDAEDGVSLRVLVPADEDVRHQ
jgi:hypothetical protein